LFVSQKRLPKSIKSVDVSQHYSKKKYRLLEHTK